MNHSFNTDVASRFGVDGAIIIENLFFWIQKNKANEKHFYDGSFWTYNSMRAFAELFPYWTHRQIERILKNLIKQGAISTGNYNKIPYDRTKWYTLNDSVLTIYTNGGMEKLEECNGKTKNVKPIPDSKPDNKTYNKLYTSENKFPDGDSPKNNTNKKEKTNDSEFETFWDLYNKKVDKEKCIRKWRKLKVTEKISVFENLNSYLKATPDIKYRKNPLTWLNGKNWEDETIQPTQQQPNKAEEQARIVEQAINNLGSVPYPKWEDPLTQKIICKMNWDAVKNSRLDQIPWKIKEFKTMYNTELGV